MSFAFGLAVFGTALAVGLRSHLAAAAVQQRDILDQITLESAAHEVLGRLAAGAPHSIKPAALPDIVLNQRKVSVELSLPEGKYDVMDEADRGPMVAALASKGIESGPLRGRISSSFPSVVELSQAWRLSSAEEDCLRRVATAGRTPEPFRPEAAAGGGESTERSAAAGDQVDVRVSLDGRRGRSVLWIRARLTGDSTPAWRLHDYRRLMLGPAVRSCKTAS